MTLVGSLGFSSRVTVKTDSQIMLDVVPNSALMPAPTQMNLNTSLDGLKRWNVCDPGVQLFPMTAQVAF
jgi:hypothetical protein